MENEGEAEGIGSLRFTVKKFFSPLLSCDSITLALFKERKGNEVSAKLRKEEDFDPRFLSVTWR